MQRGCTRGLYAVRVAEHDRTVRSGAGRGMPVGCIGCIGCIGCLGCLSTSAAGTPAISPTAAPPAKSGPGSGGGVSWSMGRGACGSQTGICVGGIQIGVGLCVGAGHAFVALTALTVLNAAGAARASDGAVLSAAGPRLSRLHRLPRLPRLSRLHRQTCRSTSRSPESSWRASAQSASRTSSRIASIGGVDSVDYKSHPVKKNSGACLAFMA